MARGDIAYVEFPTVPNRREQGGRRPAVLVIADSGRSRNHMRMVVPLTTTLSATRYPFTFQIQPSSSNGLSKPSVALVFQLRAVDVLYVEPVTGRLEDHYLAQIDEMMRQMLGL